jgi:glycosyltransferase involved in cell wall biosynthesis
VGGPTWRCGLKARGVDGKSAPVLEQARIAVVVPAYNEARWIAETVRRMPAFVDHVIVVDDASRDATASEAARAGDARVEVVRHASNRGVGAAIVTGYRRARALDADVAAVMAGDGQMHPDDLARVALPLVRDEADYVKGDRLGHPGVFRAMPPARLAGTAALAWLTRRAAGLDRLSDSQCGFTAVSARALAALEADLDTLWPRYGYPNDLLGAVARRGLRLGEVTVRPVYRGEASGLRPWHLATIGYVVGRVAYRRVAGRSVSMGPRAAPNPGPAARGPGDAPAHGAPPR